MICRRIDLLMLALPCIRLSTVYIQGHYLTETEFEMTGYMTTRIITTSLGNALKAI